jgi:uncharacterized protein with von Willebrand factor type A (vWA) domain
MPVCLQIGELKQEERDKVMTMHEPAGRLGEIVRTLKRNHQSHMQATRPHDKDTDQAATSSPCCTSTLAVSNRP